MNIVENKLVNYFFLPFFLIYFFMWVLKKMTHDKTDLLQPKYVKYAVAMSLIVVISSSSNLDGREI